MNPPEFSVGALAVPADIMDVILTLSSLQGSLRMLQAYPDKYPVNGHWPRVAEATSALQREIESWMHTETDAERERRLSQRRQMERRHREERRSLDHPREAL